VTATARRHSGLAFVTLYPKCVPLNMFPSGKRCLRPALFCIPCVHPSAGPGRHLPFTVLLPACPCQWMWQNWLRQQLCGLRRRS
jgi:hypothetical protein